MKSIWRHSSEGNVILAIFIVLSFREVYEVTTYASARVRCVCVCVCVRECARAYYIYIYIVTVTSVCDIMIY